MAYTPTYEDIAEINNAAPKAVTASYQPSYQDVADIMNAPSSSSYSNNSPGVLRNFMGGVAKEGQNILNNPIGRFLTPMGQVFKNVPTGGNPNSIAYQGGQLATDLAVPAPDVNIIGAAARVPRLLRTLGNAAAQGATYGALTANPGNFGSSVAAGALGGAGANLVGNIGRVATNNLIFKPLANAAAKNVGDIKSPQEVAAINKLIGNAPVNFGEVVGSPALANTAYNVGGLIPFNTRVSKAVGYVNKNANNLFGDLGDKSIPQLVPYEIAAHVKNNANANHLAAKALFNNVQDIANRNNVQVELPNFLNGVKNVQDDLGTNWMNTPEGSHISGVLNQLTDKLNGSTSVPFQAAHFANSKLLDKIRDYQSAGNYNGARLANMVRAGLQQDLDNAANNTPELGDAYKDAKNYFKTNVVPYRQGQITNIINGQSDLKNLPNTLLNTKNSKILDDLPQPTKNLIMYQKALDNADTNAEGNPIITPVKLKGAFNNLTDDQVSRLLTPDTIQRFNALGELNKATAEARGRYRTPQTGARTANLLKLLTEGGALSGAAYFAGLPHVAAGTGLAALGARTILKNAYDPAIRRAYAAGGLPYKAGIGKNALTKTAGKGGILALQQLANQLNGSNQ